MVERAGLRAAGGAVLLALTLWGCRPGGLLPGQSPPSLSPGPTAGPAAQAPAPEQAAAPSPGTAGGSSSESDGGSDLAGPGGLLPADTHRTQEPTHNENATASLAAQPLPPGCGGGPGENASPAPPGATVAPAWRRRGNTPFPTRYAHRSGCRFAIGGSPFTVLLHLPAGARQAETLQSLEITGAAPAQVRWAAAGPALELLFPAGPSGEATRVALTGPTGPALPTLHFTLTLIREYPTVVGWIRQPGAADWRRLQPWEVYPAGPLELELRFSTPVSHAEVESRLQRLPALRSAHRRWVDAQTLRLALASPPAAVTIDLGGTPGAGGIGLYAPPIVLRTGRPPVAAVVSPLQAADEAPLGPVPAGVTRAALDPAGDWLAVAAAVPTAAPDASRHRTWVLNRQQGQLVAVPFAGAFYGWTGPGVLLGPDTSGSIIAWRPETGGVRRYRASVGAEYQALSPDRRYLAGLRRHPDRLDPVRQVMPVDLLLLDLHQGRETIISNWAGYWPGPGQWPAPLPLAWRPDGTGVVGRTYLGPDLWDWLVYDLQEGASRILAPDESPGIETQGTLLPGPGGLTLSQDTPWGPVILLGTPDGPRNLGNGLPAGWLPDGRALLLRGGP